MIQPISPSADFEVVRGHRICIIGAGPCGLTTIKNLLAAGLDDVECFDESDSIGGNWAFSEQPSRTSVYECTHIISSKRLSAFEDFPMPKDYPDFPSHRQIRTYLEDYASRFGVMPHIHLRTQVRQARLRPDGRWSVRLSRQGGAEEEEIFDHLIVCSGHHRDPSVPQYDGRFDGQMLHSRDYKRAEPFRGKRVLVVGGGNSGADIAVDVSRVAARTCLSMRRGYNFLPKLLCGRPVDMLYAKARKYLPRIAIEPLARLLCYLTVGSWDRYGLQKPATGPLDMHPTLNSAIFNALRHGSLVPRVGIERFDGPSVRFSDGKVEPFDTVIWATGFRISFPFLENAVLDWHRQHCPQLYLKMMHPRIVNLFFIGLFQPVGCIWRLADHQARIVALQISGRLDRPADIDRRIGQEAAEWRKRFDASPRHAVEVDYHDFRRSLIRELGGARA
jgi:cation diffusion facilitator CzcD-associated flavoprotein CzcO